MKAAIPVAIALALAASTAAIAQTTTTTPGAGTPSAPPAMKTDPVDRTAPSRATNPATKSGDLTLTEAEAQNWIDKAVYSSDNENVGEVAAFARDASGKVTEMHADIGGILGIGETRVRIMPAQFKLTGDRIMLNLTSEQVKALPHLPK